MSKLKILFTNNAPLIKYGIAEGFKQLGHEVYMMEDEYNMWGKPKPEQIELFRKFFNNVKPDVCFSETFAEFNEEIFIYTKNKGVPHIFWAVDDVWEPNKPLNGNWNTIGNHWSNYADIVCTTTVERLDYYKSKNKKAGLLLFACNPEFHKKTLLNREFETDIIFVGNNYKDRSEKFENFLQPLIEKGYKVKIYGNEWWVDKNYPVNLLNNKDVYSGYLPYELLPAAYSSAKIVLGLNLSEGSKTQTSMRMTESMAVGGGILVSAHTISQENLFGEYCYLPKNTSELLSMVDEVLTMSEDHRLEKAKNAQNFVYEYHNYKLRVEELLSLL